MTFWFLDRGGESENKSIIIYADNFFEGISMIFDYLTFKHGKMGSDWNVFMVEEIQKNDKMYEVWSIEIYKGENKKELKTYYFDITSLKSLKKPKQFFKYLS
ncbi:MAG: hypothetical protein N2589_06550 [bacterium]|nr:hypothetical protein [bacterium]MCX7917764.1 hypothetical protein [bacterium]MDW8163629.1 hypothetical protein [Candidatus Omnitrophota bacterium]